MSIRHEISDILLGYTLTGNLKENLDRIMKLINNRDNQKLSLSEKLTKLSALANEELRGSYSLTLKELAEEAKTLEQERELMKYR